MLMIIMKIMMNEWMLGEAQLYIHAESTALVMLFNPYFEGPGTRGWRERGLALTYGAI